MPSNHLFILTLPLAAAGVYALFARDLSHARSRLVGRSEIVETSLGALEYALAGEGEPVLAIHGAGGGFDQSLDMTGVLAEHGRQLIAPSRFGYLRSTTFVDLTTAKQADAYVELLDHLGVDKVFVIAISAGSWSALQFAIRHPKRCRALALLSPADYLPPQKNNHGGALARAIFGSDFIAWAALKLMRLLPGVMTRAVLGTDPGLLRVAEAKDKARVQEILHHLLPVSARYQGMQFDIKTAAAFEPYPIERISCPVLTIGAEDDAFGAAVRARYIAGAAPEGAAVIYPTGGHALVGRSADILSRITSFFRAVEANLPGRLSPE